MLWENLIVISLTHKLSLLIILNNNLPQEVDYEIDFEMESLTLYFDYE